MKSFARTTLLALALMTPGMALAQTPEPQKTISVDFRGNLRDALKQIAQAGGLNLVVTGDLDQDAQVQLSGVSAEDALRTVAQAYNLKIHQTGSIWTLRPMTPQEIAAGAPTADAAAPAPSAPKEQPEAQEQEQSREQIDAAAQQAKTKALAEAERLEQLATRKQEQAPGDDDARDEARELREAARELRQKTREAFTRRGRDPGDRVSAGRVVVGENETVTSAISWGGGVEINGHVEDDAVAFGGDVTLGPRAVVEGDVVAFGGSVRRAQGAVIEGDVVTFGGKVSQDAKKEDAGEEVSIAPRAVAEAVKRHERNTPAVVAALIWFMSLFGIGFLTTLLMPERMKRIELEIRANPLKSGLTGFLSTLALFPLTVLLVVTVIGIPVAVALWVLAPVAAVVGYAAVATELGTRLPLFRGRKTQAIVLALGIAVLVLVGFVPILGPLALTFLGCMGFGAIIRTRFGARGKPKSPDLDDLPTGVPV
ncbi:MAG: polymer-forming cytoskeletal protein [Myxococcaceae bacterium]